MFDDLLFLFGLVDLHMGVFTMRDQLTGTLWTHLDGKAVSGSLAGERLEFIPVQQTTWEAWKAEHPDTTVLAFNTQYQQQYQLVPIGEYSTDEDFFGDDRLPSNALVLGVEVNNTFRGYQLTRIQTESGAVNDTLGGEPIVAAYDAATGNAMAYSRTVAGEVRTFRLASAGGAAVLEEVATGSRWTLGGQPVSGPLATGALVFVRSIITEWYGWSGYHPETGLYGQ